MTQTHSPTPWKIDDDGMATDARGDGIVFYDNDEFIVTAVNAYEANQALIKRLVLALKTTWGGKEALEAAKEAGF
jgi:hypothetical protein